MELDPETTLSHAGRDLDACFAAVPPPPTRGDGMSASDVNEAPAREALETTLANLDCGAGAVACSSGRNAAETVTHLLGEDAHLLCAHDVRAETADLFAALEEQGTLSVSYEDPSDREALTDAVQPNTEALWVETPSDALLQVVDLDTLAAFADANDLLLIVDNTILSPLLQRPIEHGADLVVYGSTTHLSGHADVDAGAIVARTETLTADLSRAAREQRTLAPAFDCWLVLRGAKTLSTRIQKHETNARSIAYDLNEHSAIDRVFYPGLRDHPSHETARDQQNGYGPIVSFVVSDEIDAETLVAATDLFSSTEHVGGIESRITFADTPTGKETVVRLSIGTEATPDLEDDLAQALDAAQVADTESEPVREPVPVTRRSTEHRSSSVPVR